MGIALPSHEEMVEAILLTYDRATVGQRLDGDAWYPLAGRVVTEIADLFGVDSHRVAHALAALSPRNPWRWNVTDCYVYTSSAANGGEMPTATTYTANQRAAWLALIADGSPWVTAARKVSSFVAAIMGDTDAIVVDVWAMRAATNGVLSEPGTDRRYRDVAYAYKDAAQVLGVTPCTAQAVTWLVAQQAGIGSRRSGRHDLAWKRSTPDFVKDLIAPDEPRQLSLAWVL